MRIRRNLRQLYRWLNLPQQSGEDVDSSPGAIFAAFGFRFVAANLINDRITHTDIAAQVFEEVTEAVEDLGP